MDSLRLQLRRHYLCDESKAVRELIKNCSLDDTARARIFKLAQELVQSVRDGSDPAILESFLAEYGLSSEEGVALMCLAEALLRVPDSETVDTLIHDKIVPADWGRHLGGSSSSLVNASTWALMFTGKLIEDEPEGIVGALRGAIRRLGEPVVRTAVSQAIKELGSQFVLGESIDKAIDASKAANEKGYTYSYDMLGEAARTEAHAKRYHLAYSEAIATLGAHCVHDTVAQNPGISVKLSALYSRYEVAKREDVMIDLVARTRSLAMLAKSANMGFNIDAEEADRLDLSLDVIEAVLSEPSLSGWNGFGIVVQAYSPRAWFVLDWLYDMAGRLNRNIMVRLVKGAYWDTEIKRAQVLGLAGFPVFTRKQNTDISYIACAEKLLGMTDRIYPQFATHNAHTVAAILSMGVDKSQFEFQRLHGMGEALHQEVLTTHNAGCRIYAPVGAHEDLLAYLVRRLLENGANSSFVNQIVDENVSVEEIAADPFATVTDNTSDLSHPGILKPLSMYEPERINSKGWDLTDPLTLEILEQERERYSQSQWSAQPLMPNAEMISAAASRPIINPAESGDTVGTVSSATGAHIDKAFKNAARAFTTWSGKTASQRAENLRVAADLYEQHTGELIALATREAGKTLADGIAEIREAVDFLRYYACEAIRLETAHRDSGVRARGTIICISPWNFPLAIFSGQIAAALATGNVVIAKPADQTPLIAMRAVQLIHAAGIPEDVIQLLPGSGADVGAALVADERSAGVCFTGSTATAQLINRSMAQSVKPAAPLIAETGGLNAMIVDSTALPEQAVRDILVSAFQSAGQRCSALRVLYIQKDIAAKLLDMLFGAMDSLESGNPWYLKTDIGPVIDVSAKTKIEQHCDHFAAKGSVLQRSPAPVNNPQGTFVCPTVIKLQHINELQEEIFGPVLHVIEFEAREFEKILNDINATGYGLTFGLHSRVDERVQDVVDGVHSGNIYINRNQIGAIVGSQPFGGKGLSGTGPKAGGPHYLLRFLQSGSATSSSTNTEKSNAFKVLNTADLQTLIDSEPVHSIVNFKDRIKLLEENVKALQLADYKAIDTALDFCRLHHHETLDLPGPTGESNRLSMHPAGVLVCIETGDRAAWISGLVQCLALGNRVLAIANPAQTLAPDLDNLKACFSQFPARFTAGILANDVFTTLQNFNGVVCLDDMSLQHKFRAELSRREGNILPLITNPIDISPLVEETSLCIDTTAAGGNATLLAISDA